MAKESITEKILFICDYFENEKADMTDGWFPTVEELKNHNVEDKFLKFMSIICYFSIDPFKKIEHPDKEDFDYKETVKYCKKILYKKMDLD